MTILSSVFSAATPMRKAVAVPARRGAGREVAGADVEQILEVQNQRSGQSGDGDEERKVGGRFAAQSAEESAEDRASRPRDARHGCDCLEESDQQRVAPADLVEVPLPVLDAASERHERGCTAERTTDEQRRLEKPFDVVLERKTDQDDWKRRKDDRTA